MTGEDFPLIVFEKIKPDDPEWSSRSRWLPPGLGAEDDALLQIMLESVNPDLLTDCRALVEEPAPHG